MYAAKPTASQLAWQELELGVIIHYCNNIYNPDFQGFKTSAVRDAIPPEIMNPTKLDVSQWVRAAKKLGAKYAVLVANHCTGFSLWPTKENDYSTASLRWKDGRGDICRDFIEACKEYDILPGFYYSTGCNGYYNINDDTIKAYKSDFYRDYVKHVEAQVKELWTEYGDLFEIWFDGGVIPPEDGGPDLVPLLKKYQPRALCFQGPRDFPNDLRWVGNENGLAPENCWATTNAGEARYDGTIPDEKAGVGDPDGKYYWPAETDMPNRSHKGFGGGWFWREGEEDTVLSPEHLLDCYIRSVGRNSNLLLGMGISTDGDFKDEEQFAAFGALIQKTFSEPLAAVTSPDGLSCTLTVPEGTTPKYLVIREDITEGQRIRGFEVLADGKVVYRSECIGHKRILPLEPLEGCAGAKEYTFRVTKSMDGARIRDVMLY